MAPIVYACIRQMFKLWTFVFYNTTELHGLDNVPNEGEATMVVFNHGNGLVDPALLIANTPRLIRFLAKDTLWTMWGVGMLVKQSGAIPVFRPREHGAKASEYNEEMYRAAFAALHRGECLAIAPEGVSRFAAGMAQPMKTGVARICMQALDSKPGLRIKVLPVGLIYTHREKFRSDVCMQYGKPIVLDASRLPPTHLSKDERDKLLFAQAHHLTEEINTALQALSLHAPDFVTLRRALTATRVMLPLGTKQTLKEYTGQIRAWMGKLTPETAAVAQCTALDQYQHALDARKIKDDRVRRFAFAEPSFASPLASVRHFAAAVGFGIIALPGCLAWSPMWIWLKHKEKLLLTNNGMTWNDSVAELKATRSWLVMVVVTLALRKPWRMAALWVWFGVTVRAYEEHVAALRSFYSHRRLSDLDMPAITELLRLRRLVIELLDEMATADGIKAPTAAEAAATLVQPLFLSTLFRRTRQKRDWNEILRTEDHNTFEYVP